jgi:hypothetical protein
MMRSELGVHLKQRMEFIRQFYVTSSAGYIERKCLIEARDEPFVPSYSENSEPAYLDKWLEADESLQILGCTCISMLAAIFHLYFKTLERQIGVPVGDSFKTDFKSGWLNGYKAYFAYNFRIKFEDCPTRLAVLEEMVLARNRVQHPESITTNSHHYSRGDLEKLPNSFFIDEDDASLFCDVEEGEHSWLLAPRIRVTVEKLFATLSEVDSFAEWLENLEIERHAS